MVRPLERRQDKTGHRFYKLVDLVPVLSLCSSIRFGCNLLGNPPHFLPQLTFASLDCLEKINPLPKTVTHKLAQDEVWCCLRFTFFEWQLPKVLRHIGKSIKGFGEAARHIAAMWRISVIIHIGHLKEDILAF